ncbi:hypothetical protein [Actinokineospora sp. HUAS TT18]|uniref:hypothetical protein n=1 Tax=Actinokineospora sp. HUAS TT18 TaxID=3447451 RepID=UPI003F522955
MVTGIVLAVVGSATSVVLAWIRHRTSASRYAAWAAMARRVPDGGTLAASDLVSSVRIGHGRGRR